MKTENYILTVATRYSRRVFHNSYDNCFNGENIDTACMIAANDSRKAFYQAVDKLKKKYEHGDN